MMENSDEAMERVLAGLRDAEAPAGMERRILEAVQSSAPRKREWSLALPWRVAGMRTCAIAVAGVVAVSSMVYWTALREHRAGSGSRESRSQMVPGSTPYPTVQRATAGVNPTLPERLAVGEREKTPIRRARFVRGEKSAALQETQAANHPAPEAPLTEEEKLLLRIAHKGDPMEIAALNPVLWAKRDAEEQAEVKKFFEPSTKGDDK
jgi:hypothetical protein